MARGTQIVPIRIPPDELAWIDDQVKRSEADSFDPHTRTSWILSAIREKIAKQKRGRRKRPKRGA